MESQATTALPTMAGPTSADLSKPGIARWEVVQALLDFYDAPRYLEVGVSKGRTFHHLTAGLQVAVDPKFGFDWKSEQARRGGQARYHRVTSDEYFGSIVDPDQLFDVIYLDGLHTFEQTLRDLTNSLTHLAPRGVIVIDDVKPPSYHASLPDHANYIQVHKYVKGDRWAWMGDVYKLIWFIDTFYQSLSYATVANNHGQAVVWQERREYVTERGVNEIGDLSFDSFVLQRETLQARPFGEIVRDLEGRIGR
jgi:hypothetical protein